MKWVRVKKREKKTSVGNWAQRRWEMKMAFECMKCRRLFCAQSMRIASMASFGFRREKEKEEEVRKWTETPTSLGFFSSFGLGVSRWFYIFYFFIFNFNFILLGLIQIKVARDLTIVFQIWSRDFGVMPGSMDQPIYWSVIIH